MSNFWFPCCCGTDGGPWEPCCGTVCMSVTGATINSDSACSSYTGLDIDRENFEVVTNPKGEFWKCGPDNYYRGMGWRKAEFGGMLKSPWEICQDEMEEPIEYPGETHCLGCFDLKGKFPNLLHQPNYSNCALTDYVCFDDTSVYSGIHEECQGRIYIASDGHVWVQIYNVGYDINRSGLSGGVSYYPAVWRSKERINCPFNCNQNLTFEFLCQSHPIDRYACSPIPIPMPVDFSTAEITMKMSRCFKCSVCETCDTAKELSAVVSGVVFGSCANCNLLNGTYSCPNFFSSEGSLGERCSWGSSCFAFDPFNGPCGQTSESVSMVVQMFSTVVAGGSIVRKMQANLRYWSNSSNCTFLAPPTASVFYEKEYTDGAGLDCNNFSGEVLTYVSGSNTSCDFSGSTVTVSAVVP